MKNVSHFIKSPNGVFLLIFVGFLVRIFAINWGAPYYFHPDERNIAALLSLNPLKEFPSYLFTGTFSYGNFPTLLYQIPKLLILHMQPGVDAFTFSTLIIRYASAIFATATLIVLYKTGTIFSKNAGPLALVLAVFSTGLIQNAHFGTFDTFITFWLFLSFYFSLLLITEKKTYNFYLATASLCIAAAAKITSITFFPIVLLAYVFTIQKQHTKKGLFLLHVLIGSLLFLLVFLLSPYYQTDEFFNLLQYERGVVTGTLDVFYTQSFHDTIPVVYQFTSIFPFLINPLLTILLPICLIGTTVLFITTKNRALLLLLLSFILLFIPQALLFAKWSRYMLPTLPFIYLLISIFLVSLLHNKNHLLKKVSYVLISASIVLSIVHSISYLAHIRESSVMHASQWATENLPSDSTIVSEQYDLGITAFNRSFPNILLFDFYSLENNPTGQQELSQLIETADYIILPSQRILRSRIINPTRFPKGHEFYSSLYYENGSFKKIYETECSLWCTFLYFGNPVVSSEETTSVFDRPTITIYKKQ